MAQVDKLLKYQETDEKILRIERETGNSEERKNYVQAKTFLTKAPEKLDALDAKATELTSLLNELNKKYSEIAETLSDFDHIDEMVDGGADISFYRKNVTQITEKLKVMKKKTIAVQKQYAEYSEVYKNFKEGKQKEALTVKKELDAIAKDIDKDVLRKYEIKRSERIFPILCPVKDGRCSKCGSELSLAGKELISSGSVVECDNCHRILYKE